MTTSIAMLHQGHTSVTKTDKATDAVWWPGMYREIRDISENCPSCRAAGKNPKIQIPLTEIKRLELSTEPNQDIRLDFAGPIKLKTRGDVYILAAIDRFSKWPIAQICKNTDTRTVIKFLTNYCPDYKTPRPIRTDNGSCFKSKDFKEFCSGEYIIRNRYTSNLHIGTGLLESTIRRQILRGNNI